MELTFENIMNNCSRNEIVFNEIKVNLDNIVPFIGTILSVDVYLL